MAGERTAMSDDREGREGRALDQALAALPQPDVDPLWARGALIAAQRRLAAGRRASGRLARYEPLLLVTLSLLQLAWAALRVFAFAR
jgi:hypothetical protein